MVHPLLDVSQVQFYLIHILGFLRVRKCSLSNTCNHSEGMEEKRVSDMTVAEETLA